MSNYTRWYRDGTLGATNGSTAVTGSGTYWKSAGLNPGDMLEVNNSGLFYEIASVNSDTSITLARAYQGSTVTGVAYAIVRNFTATMPSKIAAQTAELLRDFRKYIETDMDRITGRSAYEIAKLHGYTDTEEKWLESLKGAGEISTINSKLSRIYNNNAVARNATPRGKYLGNTITAAQYAAIANSTWDDLYLADYWILPINGKSVKATIAGFSCGCFEKPHIVLLLDNLGNFPINDTATCEGHLANSKLQTEIIPSLLEKIYPVIPEEHIMNVSEYVADAINSAGEITHYTLMQLKLFLPSRNNLGGLAWHPFTAYGLRTKDYRLHTAYTWVSYVRWPLAWYEKKTYICYQCWLAENLNATNWTFGSDDYFWGYSRPANSLKGSNGRDLKFSPYMFLV